MSEQEIDVDVDEVDESGRPSWVHCALTGRYDVGRDKPTLERTTWCGRRAPSFEFTFCDATHALLHAADGGRLQLCPECGKAIAAALENAVYEP